ncbi:MAG: 30S ribosomal protein S16 [bacterium]
MITIRLQRRGRKNDPSFRVVVLDSKKKVKTGNYLEMVGSYDPRVNRVDLKGERILAWMKEGATVSDTVHNLLVSNKIIDAKKINVLPKKTYTKPVEVVAEVAELVKEAEAAPAQPETEQAEAEVASAPEAEAAAEPVESAVAGEASAS